MAVHLIAGCIRSAKTFYHSGDLGDIIYSLPTVVGLGGGVLYLGPNSFHGMATRVPMTKDHCETIAPLLRIQHYIQSVEYRVSSNGVDFNLNEFRSEMVGGQYLDCRPGFNLAKVHLKHFGLSLNLDEKPWITVDYPNPAFPVIIARSERYHGRVFDWQMILREYDGKIGFIGTKQEHADFTEEFGLIPHVETKDLLDVARVIAGAELFVGNQSCPYAIAVGLGQQAILENCDTVPNSIYRRSNLILGCSSGTKLPLLRKPHLEITAPVENFTGYGQLVCALAVGLAKEYDFSVHPFAKDETRTPLPTAVLKRIVDTESSSGLLICSILEVTDRLRKGQILLSMFESTRMDRDTINTINQNAECVIVPTYWNASCLSANGVDVPLRIVPLGVDPGVYFYRPMRKSGVVRFGTAGRLAHAGTRKGVEETCKWFSEAFPSETDVELHVKIFEDCDLESSCDKRIIYHRGFLPLPVMVKWYEDLTAFISLTKGEGWGLHLHQAMAIGRAVIAPLASGQTAFMTAENSYCCRFRQEHPTWSVYKNRGDWAVPEQRHAIDLLRQVYRNPAEAESRGKLASRDVARFTWENTVRELVDVLKEFHML